MTVVALLADPEHVLVSAVVKRGMMEGLRFSVSPEMIPLLRQRYGASLQSFPDAIQSNEGASVVDWSLEMTGTRPSLAVPAQRRMKLAFDGEESCDGEDSTTTVHIHDMLPPARDSSDANLFRTWLEELNADTLPELDREPRHWCDCSDMAYAIVELLKSQPEGRSFNLVGRRQWSLEETWKEFSELVHRTEAGKSGQFNITHLEAKGVPAIKAVSVESSTPQHNRPSLSAIHRFLEQHDGEGWRPKTPLRQSLMFVIAMLDEPQDS